MPQSVVQNNKKHELLFIFMFEKKPYPPNNTIAVKDKYVHLV